MSLEKILQAQIQKHHSISLSEFMTQALYHPSFGYYCRNEMSIGQSGDFTTAPELSPLFAECVANAMKSAFLQDVPKSILEIGPGQGTFALQCIQALHAEGIILDEYILCERSESLIQAQKKKLSFLSLPTRIRWIRNLPQTFSGIIFANELFDALPCERFKVIQNELGDIQYLKQMVSYVDQAFCSVWENHFDEQTRSHIQALDLKYHFPLNYESELSLFSNAYFEQIAKRLENGIFIFLDYGDSEKYFYHPNQSTGTLRCFYQHQVHDNPFLHIGQQDMTVDVNFTELAHLGIQSGLSLLGYTTQAGFLLENQLLEHAQACTLHQSEIQTIHMQQAIKQLTLPTEMGERIKCMAFSKGLEVNLPGFQWQDRRMTL